MKSSTKGLAILSNYAGGDGCGINISNELTAKGFIFWDNCKITLCSPSSGNI
ncbi:MAG: hypothetical protein P0116_08000 [Candidatus Nitrosocosmicus sp.]|nr:hypothetical protein [Candidatus Nitrosocosmicus sp.]